MKQRPSSSLWLAFLLALSIPILVWAYEFGPPDAHTGGFGEPTCTECHFGTANSNGGKVTITGLPSAYTSGTTYNVTVTVFDTAQRRWGFELSARKQSDASQAGTLTKGGDGFTQIASSSVTTVTNPKIQYIEHTLSGTRLGTRDSGGGIPFNFTWTAPDISSGVVVFNVAANAANGDNTQNGDHIYTASLTLPPQTASVPAPVVFDNGTVNTASFQPNPTALAPGSLAAIFGTNLNDGSDIADPVLGSDGLLVTKLGGASVTFNGISAPVFGSHSGQVNVQIPFELAGVASAQVVVTANGQSSAPKNVPIGPNSPGIFTINQQGTGQGAVLISNSGGVFAAPAGTIPQKTSRAANRGEFITIFCTGLGAVNNSPGTGRLAPASPLAPTITTPQVTIGGVSA